MPFCLQSVFVGGDEWKSCVAGPQGRRGGKDETSAARRDDHGFWETGNHDQKVVALSTNFFFCASDVVFDVGSVGEAGTDRYR